MIVYVIGSGPSGVSVASALLDKGYQVVMLDYANQISHEALTNAELIASTNINQWNNELLNKIKSPIAKHLPDKTLFADRFPYKDGLEVLGIQLKNCGLKPSLAQGGLSNVWGASVMPYIEKDISDWPIQIDDLLPHYHAVNKFMPISAKYDNLAEHYLLPENYHFAKTSPQIKYFISLLERNRTYCNENNIEFGYSRIAYLSNQCKECGLCMHGCPFNLIYSSTFTLQLLVKNPNFSYRPNILVETFSETDTQVIIKAITRDKQKLEFVADKIVLASGVLSTAKIVLSSLKYYEPVKLKDSPYFIMPLINLKLGNTNILKSEFPTLAGLFVEINDYKISKNTIHLQLYPYNEMLLELFKHKLGKLYFIFRPIIRWLLAKTIIIQGFLHSNEGSDIILKLDSNQTLQVLGTEHNVTPQIRSLIKKLGKFGKIPTFEKAISGRSFHCGGSFPMVSDINEHEGVVTDTNGLLKGTKNVYLVDASVLPSISAQTITYTVMANAHRIGSLI